MNQSDIDLLATAISEAVLKVVKGEK